MNSENNLYGLVQILIFSTAMACTVIAIATLLFGEDNFFQQSIFPALGIILFISIWLFRSPKRKA